MLVCHFKPLPHVFVCVCLCAQLLTKDPECRLGCVEREGGEEAIRSHSFFSGLDWNALNKRELEPPFKPRIVSPACAAVHALQIIPHSNTNGTETVACSLSVYVCQSQSLYFVMYYKCIGMSPIRIMSNICKVESMCEPL